MERENEAWTAYEKEMEKIHKEREKAEVKYLNAMREAWVKYQKSLTGGGENGNGNCD